MIPTVAVEQSAATVFLPKKGLAIAGYFNHTSNGYTLISPKIILQPSWHAKATTIPHAPL